MSNRWFIFVWVLWFVILSFFFLISQLGYRSDFTYVYFVDTGTTIAVLKKHEYLEERGKKNGAEVAFATAIYEPDIQPGPFVGLIEIYVTESVFAPGVYFSRRSQTLTQEETRQAHQALIQYANADPNMVQFRPGQPAQTRFSWNLLGRSLIRLSVIALIALAITLFIRFVVNMEKSIRQARKQHGKMCVHCSYQIVGLTSAICPECGKEHGSNIEEPA